MHVWIAVNYNFKFKLFFYEISSNNNNKIIMNVYLNIFEQNDSVKVWLTRNDKFILKENRDIIYDTLSHNKVCT